MRRTHMYISLVPSPPPPHIYHQLLILQATIAVMEDWEHVCAKCLYPILTWSSGMRLKEKTKWHLQLL